MIKSVRGKILTLNIFIFLVVNVIITVFLYNSTYGGLKDRIVLEMEGHKKIGVNTLKYNLLLNSSEEGTIRNKALYEIYKEADGYFAFYNDNFERLDSIGKVFDEEDIKASFLKSNNKSSVITYNNNGEYIATYIYPVFMESSFNSNLVIQKKYTNEYIEVREKLTNLILLEIMISTFALIILNTVISRILNPLTALNKAMKTYGMGKAVKSLEVKSMDEIGEVTKGFNDMVFERNELQRIKNDFFNNGTHELKTPITSIYSYVQILKDEDLDTIEKEFLHRAVDRISLECGKMKELVQKLLDISRSNGKKDEEKQEFYLDKLILDGVDGLCERSSLSGKSFRLELEEVKIFSRREEVSSVVLNLLDNALRYSSGSEIFIWLRSMNGGFEFRIKNETLDIPDGIRDSLLEPFVKYNCLKNREYEVTSSGLGLYLCKTLCEKNGFSLSYFIENGEITFKIKGEKLN